MAYEPLPLALAVVIQGGQVLVVWNRARACWELPGGMIEPGERPREAATRELAEETSQRAVAVRCAGVATYRLGVDNRLEHGAVFMVDIGPEQPFTPTDEIERIKWWDRTSTLGTVDPLDATITDLAANGF